MYKILNKTIKQSSEKKTVLDTIVTNKVKRRNSGLDKKENDRHAMQLVSWSGTLCNWRFYFCKRKRALTLKRTKIMH